MPTLTHISRFSMSVGAWLDSRLTVLLFGGCALFVVLALVCGKPLEFLAYLFGGSMIIWLTNRRAKAMEDTVRMGERGQAIARFESALKLLENDYTPVVVGAVYALNWMAREEEKYRGPVFDVLCELIREGGTDEKGIESRTNAQKTAATLIFCVEENDEDRIYPNGARLAGANLADWNLSGMILESADLHGANLQGADLRRVDMTGARLTETTLLGVKTNEETKMIGVNLQGVQVSSIDLSGTDFSGADMRPGSERHSRFRHVEFTGCNFKDTILQGCHLDSSNFENAKNLTLRQLQSAESLIGVRGLPEEFQVELKERLKTTDD